MPDSRQYPAKLLLFGEHIVLHGAAALAVPTAAFGGQWAYTPCTPDECTAYDQLAALIEQFDPTLPLKHHQLRSDLLHGLYFRSNIPQGYGLGSSGALCAAIFDRYAEGDAPTNLHLLQQMLAQLEATIHGSSSGIDPLTAYLNQPVLIRNGTVTAIPPIEQPKGLDCFVADTGQRRASGALIGWFKEQYAADSSFRAAITADAMPASAALVNCWLEGDSESFMPILAHLSAWQLDHLTPLLPPNPTLLQWWHDTMSNSVSTAHFKLCGAGGGGYLLGFTTHRQHTIAEAEARGIQIVFPLDPLHP